MSRVLSVLGQIALFLLTAVAGMLLRPFHVTHVLSQGGFIRRQYEFDWLISVGIVYALCLVIGLLTKRIRTSWISTTIAFVLTLLVLLLFTRIGYKDANLLYGAS